MSDAEKWFWYVTMGIDHTNPAEWPLMSALSQNPDIANALEDLA